MFDASRARLDEFLRSGLTGARSTKRLVIYRASMALIFVFVALGLTCAFRAARTGDVGPVVAGLTFSLAGIIAALAGNAYRKPDPTPGGPDAPAPTQPGV